MADKKKILCVDDDPDILISLKSILESNGYIFLGADDGREGIKAYMEQQPDFIIADLMMESADSGISMVKKMRELGNTAPVYMLSSVGDMLAKSADCADMDLSGVLQKPIQSEVLLATLKLRLA